MSDHKGDAGDPTITVEWLLRGSITRMEREIDRLTSEIDAAIALRDVYKNSHAEYLAALAKVGSDG